MKKNGFFTILTLLLALSLVLSACGAIPSPEERAAAITCSEVKVVPIFDLDGNLVTKIVSSNLESHLEYSGGMYYLMPTNLDMWNAFYDEVNAGIRLANHQLANLYASEGVPGVYFYELGSFTYGTSSVDAFSCPESQDPNADYDPSDWGNIDPYDAIGYSTKSYCESDRYCLITDISGDTAYVEIVSPGGSQVNYSYPAEWLNQIMWSSFGGTDPMDFDPQFVAPGILLDEQAYGESLLQTMVGGGENGDEIAYFSFAINDFQGRNELRAAIAIAMRVAAVQAGHPVVMTLKGMLSNQQYAVANISASQDDVNVSGWMALTFGRLSASGGGGSLEASYTSSLTDVVRGSIFILNP